MVADHDINSGAYEPQSIHPALKSIDSRSPDRQAVGESMDSRSLYRPPLGRARATVSKSIKYKTALNNVLLS